MRDRNLDHMVAGISQYPDLQRRMAAELPFKYYTHKSSNCGTCDLSSIIRKYRALVSDRKYKT